MIGDNQIPSEEEVLENLEYLRAFHSEKLMEFENFLKELFLTTKNLAEREKIDAEDETTTYIYWLISKNNKGASTIYSIGLLARIKRILLEDLRKDMR
jgi:hypothetical protein